MFTLPKPNISDARKKGDRPSRQVAIYITVIMYNTFFSHYFPCQNELFPLQEGAEIARPDR